MNIPEYVIRFMNQFRNGGFEIFLVGGAVRDLLLEKTTDNWDFTSNAKPEDIQKLFTDAYYNNTYGVDVAVERGCRNWAAER
jgi:tRNA nucleotidyltransferase/poly(A) polymerase